MSEKGKPVITACKSSENWTCITFRPDLQKFGMTELEEARPPAGVPYTHLVPRASGQPGFVSRCTMIMAQN